MSVPPVARDLALVIVRVGIGVVFVAHGWQKVNDIGVDNVATGFEQMDVPLATASAWFAALVELAGGAALIAGALTPVVGLLLAADMLGAWIFVHAGNGIFVDQGGAELVIALGAASLALAAVGAGRFSVDHAVGASRRVSRARA